MPPVGHSTSPEDPYAARAHDLKKKTTITKRVKQSFHCGETLKQPIRQYSACFQNQEPSLHSA